MNEKYELIINYKVSKKTRKKYNFKFSGSNHDIYLNQKGINISFTSHQELDSIEKMLTYDKQRIQNIIQKVLLIYIILYKKTLKIRQLQLINNKKTIEDSNNKIYSLIDIKYRINLSSNFEKDYLIQKILDNKKTDNNKLIPAIHSYIYSFTKKDIETERLIYLWMAINSMYNYLQEKIKVERYEDTIGLWFLSCLLENKLIYSNYNDKNYYETALKYIKKNKSLENFNLDLSGSDLTKNITDISINTYEKVFFSYKVRCDLFHANKELLLFSFKENYDLKILHCVNNNLVSIINDILPKICDDNWLSYKLELLKNQYKIIEKRKKKKGKK